MTTPTLLLIGCGKMGGALVHGWMNDEHAPKLFILDRKLTAAPKESTIFRKPEDITQDVTPDVIILAIKPAAAEDMIQRLKNSMGERFNKAAILSVMAGKSCEQLAHICGRTDTPVVRTIPNTPSSVGAGTTGLYASPYVSDSQKHLCITLMEQVGTVVVVPNEDDLRSVTAVAGSAPAYIFLLVELLQKAGEDLGLEAETARTLVRSMVYGSGKMLHDLPDEASTMRENVTSPNGTTAAALRVFMQEDHWPRIVTLATQEAVRRAKELDN